MDVMRTNRRGRRVRWPWRVLSTGTLLGALLGAAPASGGAPPVAVGTIAAAVAEPGVKSRLRALVDAELAALALPASPRQRYLLDVSLDELKTVREGERVEATCLVSATLRDASDSALHAILKGRARAGDRDVPQHRARTEALSGAVRSALRRVPEAVAR